MRDYLPAAAAERRGVAEACLGVFERWGYRRLITPLFEYADVLARGSDTPAIRFVEPQSGEVVALRPDITPQIARLAATRLASEPAPLRLCYEGSVLRLVPQRELIQAGVELIGAPQPEGDAEVIALAAETVTAAGLPDLVIDIGHMGFLRRALAGAPSALRDAIAHKDAGAVARLAASLPAAKRKLVTALPRLYGEAKDVLRETRRLVGKSPLIDELAAALDELTTLGTRARITLDLGELRGFDYYTGVRFAGFAEGHGDAVVFGGRYDDLCGRYGKSLRSTGFAVDVEAVAGALESRGLAAAAGAAHSTGGTLVAGSRPTAPRIAAALRRRGDRAACQPEADPRESALLAYADRWGFSRVLLVGPRGATYLEPDGNRSRMPPAEFAELKSNG
jgi:ATP phosphoribosyltransferase regulatory subunit